MTFAARTGVTDLGLLKADLDKVRREVTSFDGDGTLMALLKETLRRGSSPFSFQVRSALKGSFTGLFKLQNEGVFLVECITRPFNNLQLDRHVVVFDSYRRTTVSPSTQGSHSAPSKVNSANSASSLTLTSSEPCARQHFCCHRSRPRPRKSSSRTGATSESEYQVIAALIMRF